MAFRSFNLLRNMKFKNVIQLRRNFVCTAALKANKIDEFKEYKTEHNITYLEDPECFGTLAGRASIPDELEDTGDLKEQEYLQNIPLKTQKLTTKQYADIIKQYLKNKRIKEAIDILEIRMLKEDRVKPENYIYNILIGACADVGYTKKAFKLFHDMKRRALKPTGDTYTCLFEACINCPWPAEGLKMATYLRNHMIEKGIEPNLTNYNVMIKAFGRCSNVPIAFKIADEMVSKKIKIRVHTFNHLLQACISNKEFGLKHALIVWRKMLKLREKPNLYSFNLMLKCVKDCNLGTKEDLLEVVSLIQEQMSLLKIRENVLQIGISNSTLSTHTHTTSCKNNDLNNEMKNLECNSKNEVINGDKNEVINITKHNNAGYVDAAMAVGQESITDLALINDGPTHMEVIENYKSPNPVPNKNTPNLLSKIVEIDQILALQEVHTPQDKFAIIGGQDDFLKEMAVYSVKPDIKTFTQMLPLIEDNLEAENKLLNKMQELSIKTDIDFYNALIKRRCFRQDYNSALEVREIIEKQNKLCKKHPFNKKHIIKVNIMTYGVLALGCTTKDKAQDLLQEMENKKLKVNIEILGTLLKNATVHMQFGYILYIMNMIKKENIRANDVFLKHLEIFNDRCQKIIQKNEKEQSQSPVLTAAYHRFSNIYNNWLKEISVYEVLKPENPWKQFMEPQPQPLQRDNIKIVEPKRFYKRSRKLVRYKLKL